MIALCVSVCNLEFNCDSANRNVVSISRTPQHTHRLKTDITCANYNCTSISSNISTFYYLNIYSSEVTSYFADYMLHEKCKTGRYQAEVHSP